MHREEETDADEEQPLVDLTAALDLHSRRTERLQKKLTRRREKLKSRHETEKKLLDLPFEVVMEVLSYLRPSDVFKLSRVNKSFHQFIAQEEAQITRSITSWRYSVLEKCFRAPVLLEAVDPAAYAALQSEHRQEILLLRKKPYQHVRSADPQMICTCMTCLLRWNGLNLILDFAHFQPNLEKGEPIPIIPRGKLPKWNAELLDSHSRIVEKALRSPLWYSRILETHLQSTVLSITRHKNNKGNQRKRFRMTAEDAASETDAFLARSGPPSVDFPFHRDNYYMLESYLPNRGWSSEEQRWLYMPASQHERDVEIVVRWENWRRERLAMTAQSQETGNLK